MDHPKVSTDSTMWLRTLNSHLDMRLQEHGLTNSPSGLLSLLLPLRLFGSAAASSLLVVSESFTTLPRRSALSL
jgi:hypothetical protein